MKYLLLALALGGAGAWWYYASEPPEFVPEIRTVETTRGDIVESVSATGSLEAVTTVTSPPSTRNLHKARCRLGA